MTPNKKQVFIVAGPNGAGKTTVVSTLIPAGISMVNGDLIHRQLFNGQDPSPASEDEAKSIAIERINGFIKQEESFGFESNMARVEDWKYLKALKDLQYEVNLLFTSVDSIGLLNDRIDIRYKKGEAHYVYPTIVEARYNAGLKLLDYYFNMPDNLLLIDNAVRPKKCLEARLGSIVFREETLPQWIEKSLLSRLSTNEGSKNREVLEMDSREQVLAWYQEMKSKPPKAEEAYFELGYK